ncbi:MAG: hypothetical protein KAS36_12260, partial [Anaerolineales bacterium]|nr:hypothetical protein [Anaerolineales bacterium]
MRKIRYLLFLLVIGALLIGACAPSTAETPKEAEEPAEVAEEAEAGETEAEEVEEVDPAACNVAPPDSPVTINYFGWPFEIM